MINLIKAIYSPTFMDVKGGTPLKTPKLKSNPFKT